LQRSSGSVASGRMRCFLAVETGHFLVSLAGEALEIWILGASEFSWCCFRPSRPVRRPSRPSAQCPHTLPPSMSLPLCCACATAPCCAVHTSTTYTVVWCERREILGTLATQTNGTVLNRPSRTGCLCLPCGKLGTACSKAKVSCSGMAGRSGKRTGPLHKTYIPHPTLKSG
jgi:hypothetical protein